MNLTKRNILKALGITAIASTISSFASSKPSREDLMDEVVRIWKSQSSQWIKSLGIKGFSTAVIEPRGIVFYNPGSGKAFMANPEGSLELVIPESGRFATLKAGLLT